MTSQKPSSGKVILVGAGPGDPGLLTLKGKTWLERAEVIVYDYLANSRLLGFASKNTEVIYAGKKEGQALLKQAAINDLLIEKARDGKIVVRLKGGDPFLFGRGGEETTALSDAGIPFEVVPGVPSPMGVSAYAGIPLTHRDFSSTVSIITGSNEKGNEDLNIDWEKIASRTGTLVFLMGARKLKHIAENLIKFGKDPGTPIAVIQWGTTPRQKTWTGTLKTIVEIAEREGIRPPALTIVGEVVSLKEQINWFESLPLFGKTIVVTRAEEQSRNFVDLLIEKGAEPLAFPVIETVPPEDWTPLDKAVESLSDYNGLIFTSANGVRFFMRRLRENGKDVRDLKGLRIYAIGPKTEQAINALGIRVDVVPEEYVAESLLKSLGQEAIQGKKFLLPRATEAREILPNELRKAGAEIDVVPTYRTVMPNSDMDTLLARMKEGSVHALTFTASSTVKNFSAMLDANHSLLENIVIACIGPVTAQTARDLGLKVDVMANEYTVAGLVEALETFFGQPDP